MLQHVQGDDGVNRLVCQRYIRTAGVDEGHIGQRLMGHHKAFGLGIQAQHRCLGPSPEHLSRHQARGAPQIEHGWHCGE